MFPNVGIETKKTPSENVAKSFSLDHDDSLTTLTHTDTQTQTIRSASNRYTPHANGSE